MREIELDEHQTFGTNISKWMKGQPYVSLGSSGAPHVPLAHILEEPLSLDTSLTWSGEWYGPRAVREGVIDCLKYKDLPLECIRTVNGSNEGIFNAIMTVVKPGDEVIVEMPAWYQYYAVTRYFAGATVKVIFSTEETRWKPNLEALQNSITPKTSLICLNNPCNPTGRVIEDHELQAIVDVAEDHDLWILQDEVYRGTEWDGPLAPSIVNHYDKGIAAASLTKTIGVTGLRMGWVACCDVAFMEKLHATTLYVGLCTNRLGELVAAHALTPERYPTLVAAGRELGARNLELLNAWMADQDGVHWVPPQATYCCFPGYEAVLSSWEFCKRGLLDHQVGVVPGSGFMVEGHIRLGFGMPTARFQDGLQRLSRFLHTLDNE